MPWRKPLRFIASVDIRRRVENHMAAGAVTYQYSAGRYCPPDRRSRNSRRTDHGRRSGSVQVVEIS
jgi:hypothetical protein